MEKRENFLLISYILITNYLKSLLDLKIKFSFSPALYQPIVTTSVFCESHVLHRQANCFETIAYILALKLFLRHARSRTPADSQ
jgi:hypothetical protein